MDMADWNSPDKHETKCDAKEGRADFTRKLDGDGYFACLTWSSGNLAANRAARIYRRKRGAAKRLDLVGSFFAERRSRCRLRRLMRRFCASAAQWEKFWTQGAAIDLGGSADNRARGVGTADRAVAIQYGDALCGTDAAAGDRGCCSIPGIGKSHLEMHWWHGVHFAAWNRFELLERSLDFYRRIMPLGKETARRQGYDGVRWPKMVGPEGRDSPSPIAPLLIWQQPHPIYYAELCYQRNPAKTTLDRWSKIVFESADFMASFAAMENGRYVLGPPLKSVPEHTETMATQNPTFELAYWRFGLRVAQDWRRRLGMEPQPKWAACAGASGSAAAGRWAISHDGRAWRTPTHNGIGSIPRCLAHSACSRATA